MKSRIEREQLRNKLILAKRIKISRETGHDIINPRILLQYNEFELFKKLTPAIDGVENQINRIESYSDTNLLMDACKHGRLTFVKYLVDECRADIQARNRFGSTPLLYAVFPASYLNCSDERQDVINFLLQDCHATLDNEFLQAALLGDTEKIKAMIHADPAVLDSADMNGRNALMYAVAGNQLETVRYLMTTDIPKSGRNEGSGSYGDYPNTLTLAAKLGYEKVLFCMINNKNNIDKWILNTALSNDHLEIAFRLISGKYCDIAELERLYFSYETTSALLSTFQFEQAVLDAGLETAVSSDDLEVSQLLLGFNISQEAKNKALQIAIGADRCFPNMLACIDSSINQEKLIVLLLNAGAEINLSVRLNGHAHPAPADWIFDIFKEYFELCRTLNFAEQSRRTGFFPTLVTLSARVLGSSDNNDEKAGYFQMVQGMGLDSLMQYKNFDIMRYFGPDADPKLKAIYLFAKFIAVQFTASIEFAKDQLSRLPDCKEAVALLKFSEKMGGTGVFPFECIGELQDILNDALQYNIISADERQNILDAHLDRYVNQKIDEIKWLYPHVTVELLNKLYEELAPFSKEQKLFDILYWACGQNLRNNDEASQQKVNLCQTVLIKKFGLSGALNPVLFHCYTHRNDSTEAASNLLIYLCGLNIAFNKNIHSSDFDSLRKCHWAGDTIDMFSCKDGQLLIEGVTITELINQLYQKYGSELPPIHESEKTASELLGTIGVVESEEEAVAGKLNTFKNY